MHVHHALRASTLLLAGVLGFERLPHGRWQLLHAIGLRLRFLKGDTCTLFIMLEAGVRAQQALPADTVIGSGCTQVHTQRSPQDSLGVSVLIHILSYYNIHMLCMLQPVPAALSLGHKSGDYCLGLRTWVHGTQGEFTVRTACMSSQVPQTTSRERVEQLRRRTY